MVIESAQMGIVAHGHEGGHIEGAAPVAIAGLADGRFFVHRAARGVLAGIDPGGGDPLPDVPVRREQAQKASDSPRPGRRGRGADLPTRLSILANRASATGGLPAGTTPWTQLRCNTKIKIQATASAFSHRRHFGGFFKPTANWNYEFAVATSLSNQCWVAAPLLSRLGLLAKRRHALQDMQRAARINRLASQLDPFRQILSFARADDHGSGIE